MLEDRQLVKNLKRGDVDALRRIYQKYGDSLLTLAKILLRDVETAEDILHDVFVSFVEGIGEFKLTGSLRAYLAKCVTNRVIDGFRAKSQKNISLNTFEPACSGSPGPEQIVAADEQARRINLALGQLPFEQREVILLHLHGGMKFKEISRLRGISINTIQGRYRYGIEKLRSILHNEVKK